MAENLKEIIRNLIQEGISLKKTGVETVRKRLPIGTNIYDCMVALNEIRSGNEKLADCIELMDISFGTDIHDEINQKYVFAKLRILKEKDLPTTKTVGRGKGRKSNLQYEK